MVGERSSMQGDANRRQGSSCAAVRRWKDTGMQAGGAVDIESRNHGQVHSVVLGKGYQDFLFNLFVLLSTDMYTSTDAKVLFSLRRYYRTADQMGKRQEGPIW